MTPDQLPGYLEELTRRANQAGRAAANGMVGAYDRGIKTHELIRTVGHPSAPGEPPALETGRLRASFRMHKAEPIGGYRWRSSDAPHTVYARIQEYGGTIHAKHRSEALGGRVGFLRWISDGQVHFARSVRLPERSYLRAGTRRMSRDGTLHDAAMRAFKAEMHL